MIVEHGEMDLSAYETIVIDTGSKLFEFMKPSIIRESPKNGKNDGSLSLQSVTQSNITKTR